MMEDIVRICEQPEEEDRVWFPQIAGQGDAVGVLRHAWANYRDESFILQFLSPRLMRRFKLFAVHDDAAQSTMRVDAIHDERGYKAIQRSLARHYDVAYDSPDIQIVDVNLVGDRRLIVHHQALNRVVLAEQDARHTLQHLANLWGYDVLLREIDPASGTVLKEHGASPRGDLLKPVA